jgi:hypothetical protein
MRAHRLLISLGAIALLAAACDKGDDESDGPVVERTTIGDTMIVRTISGSVWGDTARLVEELRIGALEGAQELTFGRIDLINPGPNGGIDVFDGQAVELRRFDSAGRFVRKIGARGQGPGEYQALLGLRTLSDGRTVTFDGRNSRITSYSAAGDLLETWPLQLPMRFAGDNVFVVDRMDHMYVLTGRPRAQGTPPSGAVMLRITPAGHVVDTLDAPRWTINPGAGGICLAPDGRWAMHPSGQFVAGMSDRYALDLRRVDGKVLRIERVAEPVGFESGERSELETDIASSGPPIASVMITAGKAPVFEYGPRQTVPQTKPLFKNILVGADGRIWLERHTRAEKIDPTKETVRAVCSADRRNSPPPSISWREPIVWDVFEEDGDYLGAVAVPPRTELRAARGDTVWAVQRGDSDEEYVVRFRVAR